MTRESGEPFIEIDAVTHRYASQNGGTVTALESVTLSFPRGAFVTVVGPSGCGKTTLLRMLAGFHAPTSGQVRVGGERVVGPDRHRGVVFQRPNLFPWWSVQRNVEAGPRYAGVSAKRAGELAARYLDMVGLGDFADARTWELSGGMQQRCQIARVLANEPDIVLMDEPFGALDSLTRRRLQSDVLALHVERRDTIFFITHSVEEAVYLGDHVVVLSPRPGRVRHTEKLPAYTGKGEEAIEHVSTRPEFIEAVQRITTYLEAGAA